ncbi:MFS transporter [Microbacterium pseudoresistens]|uniref:MFS family permease n=1 Tax=Microbacterium pseudoresistens TaxID=640634 RepID=A0A7Y9EWV9_9MICO|nr:MFS transporter [Microbacterium pseudoresistens]NYD55321.1 MFS family permease [Microbacterium pseudoresistens]
MPDTAPSAFSPRPTSARPRAGALWLTLFTLAWLAIWTVQLTPLQLLLPLQLDAQNSSGEWVSGVVWAGIVLSVGGLAGIVAGPAAGALSDRTRSRWGRRRPWAIGGSLVAAAGLLLTGIATGPWAIGGAWIVVSIGVAAASAALTAMIADQLTTQRGAASAAASSAQAVGIVVGVGAVVLLGLGIVASYVMLAAFIVVIGVGTALLLPDPPADHLPARVDVSTRRRLSSLRDRDFLWLLIGRLIVNIGNALGTSLLLFFLLYGIRVAAEEAEDDLLLLIVIYTVFVVIASIVVGMISDRWGHRRVLTVLAALVQAVSGLVILVSQDLGTTCIAAAVMGVGYGAYMAVSLAFATDLLRDPDDHARDLGLVNVSANLGQLLGPLIGAGLVVLVGGFWLLFAMAAALSVAGALTTLAVRNPAVSTPASPEPAPEPR